MYYCGIIKNCGGQFLVRYPQNPQKVNIEPPCNSNDSILYIFGMKFPDLGIFLEDWNSPSSTQHALAKASVQSPARLMCTEKKSSSGAYNQHGNKKLVHCTGTSFTMMKILYYCIQRNNHPRFYFCPFRPRCQHANLKPREFKQFFLIYYHVLI